MAHSWGAYCIPVNRWNANFNSIFLVDNDFCNKYEIANPEGPSYQLCREQQTTEFWGGLYAAWHWWRLMVWLAVKTFAALKKSKMVQSRNEADRDCVHKLELK